MKLLHLAPHLGGGVGKAHATLAEATRDGAGRRIAHSYALLEAPIDVHYTDRLSAAGCQLHVAPTSAQLAALIDDADIVQLEWWNHPRLYNALVERELPPMRALAWMHISGVVAPLVPRPLVDLLDHTLFTSACSYAAANLRDAILERPYAFHLVNSGFGFGDVHRQNGNQGPLRFGYLGTLDFVKLHPEFFDYLDALDHDIHVKLWGRHDPNGDVARRASAMRFPHRVSFEGFTTDPMAALSGLDVLIYLLAPNHYGTAENAMVEAMSMGVVPIVFANAAEAFIVNDRKTGFVVGSLDEFKTCIASLMNDPLQLADMRTAARATIGKTHSPSVSLTTLESVYDDVMRYPKRSRDFATALGSDARTWFLSSLSNDPCEVSIGTRLLSHITSKGSLGHFRSCFPQDSSLASFQMNAN